MKLEEWKRNLRNHLTSNFSPHDGHLTFPVYPVGTFNGELQCAQLITILPRRLPFSRTPKLVVLVKQFSAMSTTVLR